LLAVRGGLRFRLGPARPVNFLISNPKGNPMVKLTKEQEDLPRWLGKADDGRQVHVRANAVRSIHELVRLGLVRHAGRTPTGRDNYDFTEVGQLLYDELTGQDAG
jgi:hypothetical protein